jgi:septal ring factor EnvC (AmiA/AmiB activator)
LIEQAMIFALGFLVSGLLALLVLPAFWRRAMRLSRRRLEMLMPLSMAEVFAERDQLRAQAAVEQRRLERKIEVMTQDRASHMSEIGRRATVIADLRAGLADIEATLRAKEAELRHAWAEHGAMQSDVQDTSARLRTIGVELDALIQFEQQLRQTFDEQRLEKAALETRVESLQLQDHDLRQRVKATLQDRDDHLELAQRLVAERDHLKLELQTAHGWREQLTATIAEHLARIQELEQGERLERRARLRAEKELAAANKLLADAEAAMAVRASGFQAAVEAARAVLAPHEALLADAPSDGAATLPNGHDATGVEARMMVASAPQMEEPPLPLDPPLNGSEESVLVPQPMPERHAALN